MIRFILEVLFVIIFLILSIPVIFVEWLISLKWPKASAKSSQAIVSAAFRIVFFISGSKITIKGEENIPTDRPVLFVPNHRSIFDIVIGYSFARKQVGFVAKKEIRKVPVFSSWMALMNCQFLDRKDLRAGLKVINKCAELIKDGTSITIFPEGTRNRTDEPLQAFRDGSFKIAEKANCTVIPVCMNHTDDIFEKHLPKIKPTHVTVEYCAPIEMSELTREAKKQVSSSVHEVIINTYLANKEA